VTGSVPYLLAFHPDTHNVAALSATLFLSDVVMYFGVALMLEEVTFRGAFDQYVSKASTRISAQWISAASISVLWGLWHLPMLFAGPSDCLSLSGLRILLFHAGLGCVLSFTARTARSIVPSAFAHSIVNSIRNVVE
jgi:membrane protease YdiL (CAAX protease family)